MQNVVIHVDMNSYFASVEQQDNVAWRGKPLGVCEHLGGIIIAASVEAKQWGIKTGTPVWEAKKLYPKIILAKTHPDRYRLYTDRLMRILRDYTGLVEQYSIDEAFIDATRVCNVKGVEPLQEGAAIGRLIKGRMKTEVGDWLRCSIGVAENKLLAKIASDMQKPDGLTVVVNNGTHCDAQWVPLGLVLTKEGLYDRLSLIDIPGIGYRQEKRLKEMGIETLKDLRDYPRSKLIARFGLMGHHLHEMGQLNSSWKPSVDQDEDIKSLGHMYTLPKEYREAKFFVPVLYKLSEMVARRMRVQGLVGNILHFHIHDLNHECYGQSKKLGYYLRDGREIFFEAVKIFEAANLLSNHQFKLIGVTVAGLMEETGQQSLFERDEKSKRVVNALDKINEKYGDFKVCRLPVQLAGNVFRDSIGFGRIKEHIKLASFL